ncbi:MAG: hypothetical protein WCS77_02895 [Elusimicrobiaceae bacterium]
MKKLCYLLLCLLAGCGYSGNDNIPAAKSGGGRASSGLTIDEPVPPPDSPMKPEYAQAIKLSEPMETALRKYDPDFVLWTLEDYQKERIEHYPYAANSLPYAVKGDFNGDGITDITLSGHNMAGNSIVALFSRSDSEYYAVKVERDHIYEWVQKQGKAIPYTPTELLVLKPKGMKFAFSDMGDEDDEPLQFDGFKVRELGQLVSDEEDPKYLSFKWYSNNIAHIYVWNPKDNSFSYAMNECEVHRMHEPDCF